MLNTSYIRGLGMWLWTLPTRGLEGGFTGASPSRRLERGEGGLKEALRGLHFEDLEWALKPSALKGASRLLARGLYIRGLGMCKACTEAVHSEALWTRVTLGLGMCKVCTEAIHCVALWTRVTLGWGMCKVCTEAVHCVALWTRVTLGLGMCKVTLGLGMCKVCTGGSPFRSTWTWVSMYRGSPLRSTLNTSYIRFGHV